jgi:hypothetical protein
MAACSRGAVARVMEGFMAFYGLEDGYKKVQKGAKKGVETGKKPPKSR